VITGFKGKKNRLSTVGSINAGTMHALILCPSPCTALISITSDCLPGAWAKRYRV